MLVRNYFQPWQFQLLLLVDIFNFQWLFPTKIYKLYSTLLRNILRALCFLWVISMNHCWWKGSACIAAWSLCFPHLEIHFGCRAMKPNHFVFVLWFVSIVKWKRKWIWSHQHFYSQSTTSLSAEYKVLSWGMHCL